MNMSMWSRYADQMDDLSRRMGKVIRKREAHLMTRDDPALAETLANEMRACLEDIIKSQDLNLTEIQKNPEELIKVLKEVFLERGKRDLMVDPSKMS